MRVRALLAGDVERQVGADIDPGQAHDGNGGQGEYPAAPPEPGEDGDQVKMICPPAAMA